MSADAESFVNDARWSMINTGTGDQYNFLQRRLVARGARSTARRARAPGPAESAIR